MASSRLLSIAQEKEEGGGKEREGFTNMFRLETELSQCNYGYRRIYACVFLIKVFKFKNRFYCLTKISIRSSVNFPADFVCLWNPVPF